MLRVRLSKLLWSSGCKYASTSETRIEAIPEETYDAYRQEASLNVSHMKPRHRIIAAGGIPPVEFEWEKTRSAARERFGTYGLESGVDVRQCWPTIEEIEEEKAIGFYRHYLEVLKEVKALEAAKKKKDKDRIAELEANEKRYPGLLAKYQAGQVKKEKEKDAQEVALEKKIREIQEYFGYWIDPKDPRFEVMFQQKQDEEKKAARQAKRLEKEKKTIAEVL
ncbi:unnamed protein product, partial [Mesorhabditis belari]|uniref:Large ribosomal subunit protein mL64 n=1 Tax=Mesorhabditis belari TaxID=2138241 RepID=A0AAF3J7P6_9BILA